MTVLRESPWYQEILREGEQRGLAEGLEQGLEQGQKQGERSLIIRLLSRKLDCPAETIQTKIQPLTFKQLQQLGEALLDFHTMADLDNWLGQIN